MAKKSDKGLEIKELECEIWELLNGIHSSANLIFPYIVKSIEDSAIVENMINIKTGIKNAKSKFEKLTGVNFQVVKEMKKVKVK